MRFLFSQIVAFVLIVVVGGCSHPDDEHQKFTLSNLDNAIAHREDYRNAKEQCIADLRHQLQQASTDEEKFHALGALLSQYRPYNADSAFAICRRREEVAERIGNSDYIYDAQLNTAELLCQTTMYTEALEIVENIDSSDLPDYLVTYLYHVKRTLYGLLADYSVDEHFKARYRELLDVYRDSLLMAHGSESVFRAIIMSDKLNSQRRYADAIDNLKRFVSEHHVDSTQMAVTAFTLADSYHGLGDKEKEKQQLIISAITDMKLANKEYISLRSLSLMLFEEGDIEHAYHYLKICMEDAQECNARLRQIEINGIFQQVNDMYIDTIDRQQALQRRALAVVGMLSLFLLISIAMVWRQHRKASVARRNEEKMNHRLTEINSELRNANSQLLAANQAIAENSYLKEEYVARYMDQCLVYIEKLDNYRKQINKLALSGRIDDIKKQTKSGSAIDNELKAFYDNFDETFLRLFPTFVADFNSLLRPDEQIIPKVEGKLNPELRIFALIRLGINDSTKIARFLRYSVTTIYNYRTRIRNRALNNRDTLEADIMQIGHVDGR